MKKKIFYIVFVVFALITIILILKSINDYKNYIPKVYLEGDISNMTSKEDEREVLMKYRSYGLNFDKYIKIKVQGTSSLSYEKKNYTINFYKDNTYENKEKVDVGFGWGGTK